MVVFVHSRMFEISQSLGIQNGNGAKFKVGEDRETDKLQTAMRHS
jgi:hypothetical protein